MSDTTFDRAAAAQAAFGLGENRFRIIADAALIMLLVLCGFGLGWRPR